jgi:hypothetical protein
MPDLSLANSGIFRLDPGLPGFNVVTP